MNIQSQLTRIFGVGPSGIVVTIFLWITFFWGGNMIGLPEMKIGNTARLIFLLVLLIDAVYLLGSGTVNLVKNEWGNKLITDGPFQFIRHPLYSALIYSATGSLALWQYSWGLLVSVLPVSLFWSWNVIKEEKYMINKFGKEYKNYMETTGQFLPSWKALKEETEKEV